MPTQNAASVLALATASVLVMLALVAGTTPVPPSGVALLVVAIPTFVAPLFWSPGQDLRQQFLSALLGWAVAVLTLGLVSRFALDMPFALTRLGPACLVAFGILVVVKQAASIIEATLGKIFADAALSRDVSTWLVTAALWLAGSAPLWLGPVADLGGRHDPEIPTCILASSPLAHLAAAAGHDLLRGEWFYAHSSLGSLQVEYPRVDTLLIAYAFGAAALSLLLVLVRRRPKASAGGVSSIPSVEHSS